jgi:hypothetical protein
MNHCCIVDDSDGDGDVDELGGNADIVVRCR